MRHSDKISMMYICKKFNSICVKTMFMNKLKAIYCIRQNFSGKTFVVGMQMTMGKLLRLHHNFMYSTKIRGRIFAIECKTVKPFHLKVLPHTVLNFDI